MMRSLLCALSLLVSIPVSAACPDLTASKRDAIRFRLENHFNEADLTIKNQKVDQADAEKQKKIAAALRVFERIPFEENSADLKKQLEESAKEHGLKVIEIRFTPSPKASKPAKIPAEVNADQTPPFKLRPEQISRELRFTAKVTGAKPNVEVWMDSWRTTQLRLAIPVVDESGEPKLSKIGRSSPASWKLEGKAFWFLKVEFPKIRFRDPSMLLSEAGMTCPIEELQGKEPIFADLVKKTRELMPQLDPLLEKKRGFLLDQARLDFFFSQAQRREKAPAYAKL